MDISALSAACFIKDVEFAQTINGDEAMDDSVSKPGLAIATGNGNGEVIVYSSEVTPQGWRYRAHKRPKSPNKSLKISSPITSLCSVERVQRVDGFASILVSGNAAGETSQIYLTRPTESNDDGTSEEVSLSGNSAITHVTIDQSSSTCASSDATGVVKVFGLGSDKVINEITSSDGTAVNQAAFLNSHTLMVVGSSPEAQARQYDLRQPGGKGTALFVEGGGRVYHSVAINPMLPDTIAVGDDAGMVSLWDARQNKPYGTLQAHTSVVGGLCYHPQSSSTLLSISDDGTFVEHSLYDDGESRVVAEFPVPITQLDAFVSAAGNPIVLLGRDDERIDVLNLDEI